MGFQFQNKYFKIRISILSSLVLVSSFIVQSTIALDSRFQGFISINRRILHQPLFPENTAPPSPPPPPSPPDLPFFPEVPGGGSPDQGQEQQQTPPPPLNGVGNATVATTKKEKSSKTFVIGISIGIIISAILLLGLGFFFFYKFRMKESDESQNKFREILTPQESVLQPSNYLYVGTVEPVAERSVLENKDSNGSVHKRLSSVKMADRYRPSPELQPLPPLTKTPLPPPIADNSPFLVSSSDEEEELESHESTFYTPQGSSLSNEEGCNSHFPTSNNRFRADNAPAVISSSSSVPLPHSRRTSPKSRFITSPPENLNPIVNPPLKQSPEAPLQINKPTIPIPNIPIRPKFSTLPPPPDFARLQLINKQTHEFSRGSIPPPPPPPLPPPPPPLPSAKEISTRTTQKVKNPQVTSPTLQFGSKVEQLDCFEEEEEEDNPLEKNNGNNGGDESRPKLKPLHWDKVRASSDRATVWDTLNSSSFQLNEDVMESLFGCESSTSIPKEVKKKSVMRLVESDKSVLDPKKSHNIAILLRALNVTRDEVSEALLDGNLEGLGPELLETLVKMAPTKEEEIKLRDYNGDTSKLGSAERFLKAILDIPLAFKRVDAMLYKANFDTEVNYLTKSFLMLEEASKELKNSKLFLKLLEAVLRTGNRMNVGTNRGDATSFKLDTLLKLADVKGTDGKTTLLHFVVQEIIKTEEIPKNLESNTRTQTRKDENLRKQGLHILAGLSKELENVKKAASMDSDVLSSYVSKLESGLEKIRLVLGFEKTGNEKGEFFESMKKFLNEAEESIGMIKLQEQKALDSVKEATQYFHGDAAKEEAHPFRIFVIVRDFISILEKVCKEVGKIEDRSMVVGTSSSFRGTTSTSTTTLLPRISDYKNVRKDGSTSSDGFSP